MEFLKNIIPGNIPIITKCHKSLIGNFPKIIVTPGKGLKDSDVNPNAKLLEITEYGQCTLLFNTKHEVKKIATGPEHGMVKLSLSEIEKVPQLSKLSCVQNIDQWHSCQNNFNLKNEIINGNFVFAYNDKFFTESIAACLHLINADKSCFENLICVSPFKSDKRKEEIIKLLGSEVISGRFNLSKICFYDLNNNGYTFYKPEVTLEDGNILHILHGTFSHDVFLSFMKNTIYPFTFVTGDHSLSQSLSFGKIPSYVKYGHKGAIIYQLDNFFKKHDPNIAVIFNDLVRNVDLLNNLSSTPMIDLEEGTRYFPKKFIVATKIINALKRAVKEYPNGVTNVFDKLPDVNPLLEEGFDWLRK